MLNIFYIYNISILFVFCLFSLKWSSYYQTLDEKIIVLYIAIFIFNIVLGKIFKKLFKFRKIKSQNSGLNFPMILIMVGYSINFLYSYEIPLINVISGKGSYYKEIRVIGTFYPLLTAIAVFYIIYYFYLFICLKNKKYLYFNIILNALIVLNMGRGIFIMANAACFFVYLSSFEKLKIKKIFKYGIVIILIFYFFGYIGNMRTPKKLRGNNLNERILILGDATKEFRESIIPKEYFWVYLYSVSPISNLNNYFKFDTTNDNITNFYKYNFLPQSIQKRIGRPELINKKKHLVEDNFNVSTAYMLPFYQLGIGGIILFQLTTLLNFIIGFFLVKNSNYKVTYLALNSVITIFLLFENIYVLDIIWIPNYLCIFLALCSKVKIRKRE